MTIRFLAAPSMSGTTAFLRAFENNPHVKAVYYQPLKSSLRETGKVSYDFLNLDKEYPEDIYIVKDTIGKAYPTSSIAEMTYKLYRNASDLEQARYIFLFRNPFNHYKSNQKWDLNMNDFKGSYFSVYEQAIKAKKLSDRVSILTLECLANHPERVFQLICKKWGIPYHDNMMDWKLPFGTKLLASDNEMQLISDFQGHFDKIMTSKTFAYRHKSIEALNLSSDEEKEIANNVLPVYQEIQKLTAIDFPL
ncbi:MAG: hypothetical protein J7647_17350 [Cyanobacteria bacterium SBLK]|nr:hypothetical protein [Cyanobacteria bacterium SBLK]